MGAMGATGGTRLGAEADADADADVDVDVDVDVDAEGDPVGDLQATIASNPRVQRLIGPSSHDAARAPS